MGKLKRDGLLEPWRQLRLLKTSKMVLCRKGFLAGALVDVWAYILFIVLIVVFYIVFKVMANASIDKMEGSSGVFEGNLYSSAYLRMPVTVEGIDMTMADLIRLADADDEYEDAFEDNTSWFFEKTVPKDRCFLLNVNGNRLDHDYAQSSCTSLRFDADMKNWVTFSGIPLMRFRTMIPSFGKTAGKQDIAVFFYYDIDNLKEAYSSRDRYSEYVSRRQSLHQGVSG